MFEMLEAGIGLDIILWFQDNRTGWMEILSQILDQLGGEVGYIAIFGLIYWVINKRQGLHLILALFMIALVTFILKDSLMRPRPFVAFPDLVTPVFEASGFGLPSGHTSFAVMIWGYIALWVRKWWMWVFAIFYIILQATGRMVAGVHFPQDIVLGLLIGIITLALYYPISARWEDFWHHQSVRVQLAIALVIPLLIAGIVMSLSLSVEQIEAYLTMVGLVIGAGIGNAIESHWVRFTPHPKLSQRLALFFLGAVSVLIVLLGLSPLFDAIAETGTLAYLLRIIRYSLAGVIAIAIVPYIGIQLNIAQSLAAEKLSPANAL
ncbi:MAG: phosphatase PAP2 family protein [Phototrophicaceae bacterium]